MLSAGLDDSRSFAQGFRTTLCWKEGRPLAQPSPCPEADGDVVIGPGLTGPLRALELGQSGGKACITPQGAVATPSRFPRMLVAPPRACCRAASAHPPSPAHSDGATVWQ